MSGAEERGDAAILERMTRRERVLRDQSDALRSGHRSDPRSMLAVIDMESNGLKHSTYPIEVGYAIGHGMEPAITGSMLVSPRASWASDSAGDASLINGIDPVDLEDASDADSVCDILDRLLDGMTMTCDGGSHDRYWLNRLYDGRVPAFTLADVESDIAARIQEMRGKTSFVHRAGPDSLWLYRAIRIARGEKRK